MISKSLDTAAKVLKPQLKVSYKPCIENLVFRLHTKSTVLLLLIFFFLVCTREYFGDHIKCLDVKGIAEKLINNYCFFMTTFTIVTNDGRHLVDGNIPHPGLGPQNEDRIIKHKYYQWVPFMLFFQCVCFYIPHLIWKKEEGGRMKALVSCLEYARLAHENDTEFKIKDKAVPCRSDLKKKVEIIGKDVMLRLKLTRSWSVGLITTEVLNLLHLIVQIWITNAFLNGKFLSLGTDWLQYDRSDENATDPLEIRFPMVTKCNFTKFGPSGDIMRLDTICVMSVPAWPTAGGVGAAGEILLALSSPGLKLASFRKRPACVAISGRRISNMSLNVIYEKIYLILWFWFLILMVLSILAIIWRLVTFVLYKRVPKFTQLLYRRVTPGHLQIDVLAYVIQRCYYADWLFLYYLAKNMPGFLFEELFNRIYDEMKQQERDSSCSIDDECDHSVKLLKKKVYDDEFLG